MQKTNNSSSGEKPTEQLEKPRLLLAMLTPVNLFTGVLSCGVFCFLNLWMDRRWLPESFRLPLWPFALNLLSGAVFLALGLKGYWDSESRSLAVVGILGILFLGVVGATLLGRRLKSPNSDLS